MSTLMVQAWKCDVCGHIWLAGVKPKRCSKCKRPNWDRGGNNGGSAVAEKSVDGGVVVEAESRVEDRARPVRVLGAGSGVGAGAVATKPVDVAASPKPKVIDFYDVGEIPEEILRGLVLPGERVVSVAPVSVELPLCLHQWWEEGEQFECLMDQGHREAKFNKHGLHNKVRKISE